jgi:hypothetical protein
MTSTAAYLLIKTAYARHGGIGASNEGTQHRRLIGLQSHSGMVQLSLPFKPISSL